MSMTLIFDRPGLSKFRQTNDFMQAVKAGSYTLVSISGSPDVQLWNSDSECVAVFNLSDQHLELTPERSLR